MEGCGEIEFKLLWNCKEIAAPREVLQSSQNPRSYRMFRAHRAEENERKSHLPLVDF
jgi:hypothetical protein